MLSFVVLILLIISTLTSRTAADNKTYSTGISFESHIGDSILNGFVIERATVTSTVECGLKCVSSQPDCKSFNYVENSSETAICEINNSSKSLAKKHDFVFQERSQYFEPVATDEKTSQDFSQEVSTTNKSYKDGPWTLVARFSNKDSNQSWMEDQGTWWYDKVEPYGKPLDPADNADMISEAFWLLSGTEFKITRSDDSTHTALLTTTGNCLGGKTFRSKMATFGTFRGTTSWASNKCRGSCSVSYGGSYTTVVGFGQSECDGNMQPKDHIGFWCDYSDGDGSVLMIGGGGDNCDRADHGIGITEDGYGRFETSEREFDFGEQGKKGFKLYALNLWVSES